MYIKNISPMNFYHISNSFKNIINGRLIYLSDNTDYQINQIKGLNFLLKAFGNYGDNSSMFVFNNKTKLKLLKIDDELILNILQMKLSNQKLIYFLKKNKLNGFFTEKSFKNITSNVYLILIDETTPFEVKKIDTPKINISYSVTVYYIFIICLMFFNFVFDKSVKNITNNIKKNQLKDLVEFKQLYSNNQQIKKKGSLRIATYNIHYFRDTEDKATLDRLADYIQSKDIDILCLQEVVVPRKLVEGVYLYNYETVKKTFTKLGYSYFMFDKKSFLFVASKIKLENKQVLDLNYNRKALLFDIKLNETITIVNTHLFTDTNKFKNNNQKEEDIRYKQVKKILNNISNNKSIILGDFNSLTSSDYTDKEMRYMKNYEYIHTPEDNKVVEIIKKKYKDSHELNNTNQYTHIHKRRVDYIFYNEIDIKQYHNYSNFDLSDHSMLIVDL